MKPYQALIWNEWRQIRGNVLALAGVTALLWLLLLFSSYNKAWTYYIEMIATALALGLPLLYSIVLADSFAREFSQKTDSFLLELPVSPTKIFFCKYLANLVSLIGLAVFETLSMLHLTRLTPGKHFIDGFQLREWIIGLVIIAAIWIFAHAMVFLTSLLVKKSGNGIVAIIIMPLAIILLLPGTMAITMFFFKFYDDWSWGIVFLLLTFIILYCFCIGFGVYLWARWIACGKRVLKPLIAALAIMLTAPWVLFGIAYLYTNLSFNSAVREARAAGLEMDFNKLAPPPVPDDQNAVPGVMKFLNEYKPIHKLNFGKTPDPERKAPAPLPSQCPYGLSWADTDFSFYKEARDNIPQKNILELTDFIINAPRMNQCYSILLESLKKKYCRFSRNYTARECYDLDFSIGQAASFLSDMAYAFRVSGRNDDFFACLADIDKIAVALTGQPFVTLKGRGLSLKTIEYRTAIAAGPDTVEAVKSYNTMLRDIDSINPTMPDETFRIYSYLKGADSFTPIDYFIMMYRENSFFREFKLPYIPRKLQSAAAWVRWKIQEDKLLKQAISSASIKEVAPEVYKKLSAGLPDKLPPLMIWNYFRCRAEFETYKLCLALKVYNINHCRFPESLQQLVPEILPKIPINPETGIDYTYQVEADGFYLSSYPVDKIINGIKYKTWKLETEKAK